MTIDSPVGPKYGGQQHGEINDQAPHGRGACFGMMLGGAIAAYGLRRPRERSHRITVGPTTSDMPKADKKDPADRNVMYWKTLSGEK